MFLWRRYNIMNKLTIEDLKTLVEAEKSKRLEKERGIKEEEERRRLELAPLFLEYFEEIVFGAKILTLKENGNFDLFGYEMFPFQAGMVTKTDLDDKYKNCRGYILASCNSAGSMIYSLESAYEFVEERNAWKGALKKKTDKKLPSFWKFWLLWKI